MALTLMHSGVILAAAGNRNMPEKKQLGLLGRGLYSPTEASRLTRVPIRRINRWTRGYWYVDRGKRQWSDPIVGLGRQTLGDAPVLEFADLLEVRCLSAFRDQKIGWPAIRVAFIRAKEVLKTPYPFSSNRFKVSGRAILAEVTDDVGDKHLLDLVRDQWVFERLVFDSLRKGLHYAGADSPQWWTPLGEERKVMVHPARAFGAPIVFPGSIRTRVLYGSFQAEHSAERVADWYGVTADAVRDAVEFEEGIRRAA
jgi:uncharacterized protein (DUF433 family)